MNGYPVSASDYSGAAAFHSPWPALYSIADRMDQKQALQTKLQTLAANQPGGGNGGSGMDGGPGGGSSQSDPSQGGGGGNPPQASGPGLPGPNGMDSPYPDSSQYEVPAQKSTLWRKLLGTYAPDKSDQFTTMSLPQLEGYASAMSASAQNQKAAQQSRLAFQKGRMYDAQTDNMTRQALLRAQQATDEQGTGDLIKSALGYLDDGNSSGPGAPGAGGTPSAADISSYAGGGQPAPASNPPPDVMQALARAAQSSPSVGGRSLAPAISSMAKLQAMQQAGRRAAPTPGSYTSPSGASYTTYGNTIMSDQPPIDTDSMPAPDGYSAVPNGKGGVQYLRTGQKIPPQFNTVLDQIGGDMASAKADLAMDPQAISASGRDPQLTIASANKRLAVAKSRAQSTIDRYTTSGVISPDQQSQFYREFDLDAPGSAPAAPSAKAGNAGTVRVIGPNGRTGTIPASQLKAALGQGYKQAP